MSRNNLNNSNCADSTEKLMPTVNFNSCASKGDCVTVCPYTVFEMQAISKLDKAKLNMKGRIKTFFFNQKAYVINPEQCHVCGLCVQVCPEKAINLTRFIKANK
ncbi:MAG: hypothetical protein RL660_1148 [Bacteroidota bacterium]|jgi:NAD-dependent dihydropyrimidine dehydrogenase PreA subunit